MKKIILTIVVVLLCSNIFAQTDVITGMTGTQVRGAINSNFDYIYGRHLLDSAGIASNNTYITHKLNSLIYGHKASNLTHTSAETGYYNTLIGLNAGTALTIGYYNTMVGYNAGYKNTIGYLNTLIGYGAGSDIDSAVYQTMVGVQAGRYSRGIYNIGIGFQATYGSATNCTGLENVGIGVYSLQNFTNGVMNVAICSNALNYLTSGSNNVAIGYSTGSILTTGSNNVLLGYQAGGGVTTGGNNIHIGFQTGSYTGGSNYQTLIGAYAGKYESASGRLYIDNYTDRQSFALGVRRSLIYGTFGADSTTQFVRINGYLMATGTTSSTGTALVMDATGRVYMATSSKEFKKNIRTFNPDIESILKIKPVKYEYKETNQTDIGYLAEEFESLGLKSLLNYKDGKPFSIKYDKLSIYIIEILKAQEKQINDLESRMKKLESK
jgi:hypothetical protein